MELTYVEKDIIRLLLIIEKDIFKYYRQLSFNLDDLEARANLKRLIEEEARIIRSLKLTEEKYNLICEFVISIYNKPIDVGLPTVINPLINGDEFLKCSNYHYYRLIVKCHRYLIDYNKCEIPLRDRISNLECALLYDILLSEIEKTDGISDYLTRILYMYSFNTLIDDGKFEKRMLSYKLDREEFIMYSLNNYRSYFKANGDVITGVNDETILDFRKEILEKVLGLLTVHVKNNLNIYKTTSRYYFLMSYIKVLVAVSPITFRSKMYEYIERHIIENDGESSVFLNILYLAELDIENNIVPSMAGVIVNKS